MKIDKFNEKLIVLSIEYCASHGIEYIIKDIDVDDKTESGRYIIIDCDKGAIASLYHCVKNKVHVKTFEKFVYYKKQATLAKMI